MSAQSEVMLLALAVKKGLISKELAQVCIDAQKQLRSDGSNIRLEELAVARGYLKASDIDHLRKPPPPTPKPAPHTITLEEAQAIDLYTMDACIGTGGMAAVFRARLRMSGELRAVKVLFKEHAEVDQYVNRFVREAKFLQSFDCANIARGYEAGCCALAGGRKLYYVGMELIEGPSLQDLLDQQGPFSEQMALYCVTEAAKALAYMQARGIVHRDIKPGNIIWSNDGRIVIVDLGFSKAIRKDVGASQYEAETCGTVQYISPEQARGRVDLDIRADIYSLGATLYHLVVGELPFTGKSSMEVMSKQVMESLNAKRLKGGKLSSQIHYFIEKMMAKDREMRYQSAQDFVDDVEIVLAGAADLRYSRATLKVPKNLAPPSPGPIPAIQGSSRRNAAAPGALQGSSRRLPTKVSGRQPSSGSGPLAAEGRTSRRAARIISSELVDIEPSANDLARKSDLAPLEELEAPATESVSGLRLPRKRKKPLA